MDQLTLDIARKLISMPSITPADAGCTQYILSLLNPLGFSGEKLQYGDTTNLYATFGSGARNLCYLGHVDVVPPGNLGDWSSDPFQPRVEDGVLYGRGAVDMKGSVAAFISALSQFLLESKINSDWKISILLTSDEEASGQDGVKKALEELVSRGVQFDYCLVGEPTSNLQLGDIIKIGRRGSVNFELNVLGIQGHVAYPDLAKNPTTALMEILHELKNEKLDEGSDFFDPSNLEIVYLNSDGGTSNVIPPKATARFNIRFCDKHSGASMASWVRAVCERHSKIFGVECTLKSSISGESFKSRKLEFANIVGDAILNCTKVSPQYSSTGGTSDARFMQLYCDNIAEIGLKNATAHHVDECCSVEDLTILTMIYKDILQKILA